MHKMIFPVLSLFACTHIHAQLSKNQLEGFLTNSSNRTWEFKKYVKTLGNACSGEGQLFTFFADGRLHVKKCKEGKPEVVKSSWKIEPVPNSSGGEWMIRIGPALAMDEYALDLMRVDLPLAEKNKKGKKMIWRDIPQCKSCYGKNAELLSTN